MKNVGNMDSMIRYGLAVGMVIVGLVLGAGSLISIVLYVLAVVMIVTASVRVCPIYLALGLKTNSKK